MTEWMDKLVAAMRVVLVAVGLFGVYGQVVSVSAQTVSGQQQAQQALQAQPTLLTQLAKAASTMHGISTHKTSLLGLTSYTIYYGAPTPQAIAGLRAYPLVILEPRNWTTAQLLELKSSGTKIFGYLSVLEQNRTSNLLKNAQPFDYLWIDGQRDSRAEGQSWAMNINSRHYRDLLFDDTRQQIVKKGLDGVFLDTMGDADDGIWSDAISDRQRTGAAQFVADLRGRFPDLSLVQNWGIGALKDLTAPYLDGILWENFDPSVVASNSWCKSRMEELDNLHQTKGLSVLTEINGGDASLAGPFDLLNQQHGYVGHWFADGYDSI